MEIAKRIKNFKAFESLSDTAAAALAGKAKQVSFKPGETILKTGEPGNSMFAILNGDAEARVPDRDGQVRFIRRLTWGDVFGEMSLLTGEPRTADVLVPEDCEQDCECLVLKNDDVEPLLHNHPAVARFLTDILGERLLASDSLRQLGKYRLLGELGRGAMARVFEGYHAELDRAVAVKMLNHSLVYEKDFADRFRHEARLIADLRHPNIIHLYDFMQAYGTWFIVMERLRGRDLNQVVEQDGPMTPDQVRTIIVQAASALACAHEHKIVHRDVKPSNMFLEKNGSFKLMDFGIALGPGEERAGQDLSCTPEYAAPELLMSQTLDSRTDIYSLGLSAWTLLAGRDWANADYVQGVFIMQITQEVTPIEQIVPGTPEDLCKFIHKATQKKPEDRYESCQEILEDLGALDGSAADQRSRLILATLYPNDAADEIRKLVAETREQLKALPGVDARLAEMPFEE